MSAHHLAVLAVWGAVWYVAGVFTGTRLQHHRLTREITMQIREAGGAIKKAGIGPMLMAVALVLLGAQLYFGQRQHNDDVARITRLSECVATYENQFSASLSPISAASKQNGGADIAWKRAVARLFVPGHNKRDTAAVKRTLAHNIAVYDRLARERALNPYPRPPRVVCPQ